MLKGYWGTNAVNAKGLGSMWDYLTSRGRQRAGVSGVAGAHNATDARALRYSAIDKRIELHKLHNVFIRRFLWTGLPCPEYFLEKALLFNGIAVAFRHATYGNMLLPCTITKRNVYGEPLVVNAIGLDYIEEVPLDDKAVLLYESPIFTGAANFTALSGYGYSTPAEHLDRAAEILGDLHTTAEIYSWGLKTPMLLHATSDTAKSIKMAAERILSNEPYVVIETVDDRDNTAKHSAGEREVITQFNSPATPIGLRGIFQHKIAYYNDVIGTYGLGGLAGAGKMAQTTDAEVAAGNYSVDTTLQQATRLREKFAKEMSRIYGSAVSVVCNVVSGQDEEEEEEEGDDNGKVGK